MVKLHYVRKGKYSKHVEFSNRMENVLWRRGVHQHSTSMNHVEIDVKTRYRCLCVMLLLVLFLMDKKKAMISFVDEYSSNHASVAILFVMVFNLLPLQCMKIVSEQVFPDAASSSSFLFAYVVLVLLTTCSLITFFIHCNSSKLYSITNNIATEV